MVSACVSARDFALKLKMHPVSFAKGHGTLRGLLLFCCLVFCFLDRVLPGVLRPLVSSVSSVSLRFRLTLGPLTIGDGASSLGLAMTF
jgi:hypothetical protein